MKKCPKCAEYVQDEAKVCPHCRAQLAPNYLLGAIVFLIVMGLIYVGNKPSPTENTAALIVKAHRACEAQTGRPCTTP